MTEHIDIDGEALVETAELVPYEGAPPPPPTLFRAEEPAEVVANATATAKVLAEVIYKQKLSVGIGGREHVRVEGWTLCGTMLGVYPVCVWTHKLEDGWEARVEARTRDGFVVGAAEAECLYSERTWKSRDDFALRSMAQTRATSKALRQPLGFVMTLAGFDPTPAEEMPRDEPRRKQPDSFQEPEKTIPAAQGPSEEPQNSEPRMAHADTGGGDSTTDDGVSVEFASGKQVTLLWTRVRGRGVDVEVFRRILLDITGQGSSKAIPARLFERVLEAVEAAPVESQFKPPPGAVPE